MKVAPIALSLAVALAGWRAPSGYQSASSAISIAGRATTLPRITAVAAQVDSIPAPPAAVDAPESGPLVAVTRHFNVFLMPATGGHLRPVTTRGTGYAGIYYPWYQWSPDGRYLLLVRARGSTWTVLLLARAGRVLRTLGSGPAPADFYPSWALDRDAIVYVAAQRISRAQRGVINDVVRLDLNGRHTTLWRYLSHEGCGGGTPDPAEQAYWSEVGFGGTLPAMQWSVGRHLAIYSASCTGGLNVTDTSTGRTHFLESAPHSSFGEAALSPRGELAATTGGPLVHGRATSALVLVNPGTGTILHRLGVGELPLWSPDGRTLYFVRRIPGRVLSLRDELGNRDVLQTYTSSIWAATANGTGERRLTSQNKFALGPLNLTSDGRSLIYSAIDNDWALWSHRLAGNRYTAAMLQRYRPAVNVERLELGARPVVLAPDAGRPALEPR